MSQLAKSRMAGAFDAIETMDRVKLLAQWERRFGATPPKHTSVKLMRSVLSWETQAKVEGGLAPSVARTLRSRARQLFGEDSQDGVGEGSAIPNEGGDGVVEKKRKIPGPSSASLRPGVQLMREWNGRTYRVEVINDGFRMDGKDYASLSAIAKRITGSHWSGPRFFGLKDRRPA